MSTDPEHIQQADRVLKLLDRSPGLRNTVVLRLLERGDITEHVRFLIDNLELKVAGPWEPAQTDDDPFWYRTILRNLTDDHGDVRTDAATIAFRDGVYRFNVAVHGRRETGQADDFIEACARVDALLSAGGWVLL